VVVVVVVEEEEEAKVVSVVVVSLITALSWLSAEWSCCCKCAWYRSQASSSYDMHVSSFSYDMHVSSSS
jgi:hypothetical protein